MQSCFPWLLPLMLLSFVIIIVSVLRHSLTRTCFVELRERERERTAGGRFVSTCSVVGIVFCCKNVDMVFSLLCRLFIGIKKLLVLIEMARQVMKPILTSKKPILTLKEPILTLKKPIRRETQTYQNYDIYCIEEENQGRLQWTPALDASWRAYVQWNTWRQTAPLLKQLFQTASKPVHDSSGSLSNC